MNPNEFWAKAKAAGPWYITGNGMVRNRDGCDPLGAVMGTRPIPGPYFAASVTLNIPPLVTKRIANAADFSGNRLRPLLLRCLGMEAPTP